MQLNAEGRARFQGHLQNVLRKPCSLCGNNNWQIEDSIFELREFDGGGLSTAGAVKPVLSMTCTGCGHTLFISPLTTGIVQFQQEAAPEAPAAELPAAEAPAAAPEAAPAPAPAPAKKK